MGKKAARKNFFWLETSKNEYSREGGGEVRLQVSLSSSQCALLLTKNTLLFPEFAFFPRMVFLFSINVILFSRIAFFLFYFTFLMCIFFLCFFFFLIAPSPCPVQSCSWRIFPILLFCFLLELFIDLLMMPS